MILLIPPLSPCGLGWAAQIQKVPSLNPEDFNLKQTQPKMLAAAILLWLKFVIWIWNLKLTDPVAETKISELFCLLATTIAACPMQLWMLQVNVIASGPYICDCCVSSCFDLVNCNCPWSLVSAASGCHGWEWWWKNIIIKLTKCKNSIYAKIEYLTKKKKSKYKTLNMYFELKAYLNLNVRCDFKGSTLMCYFYEFTFLLFFLIS